MRKIFLTVFIALLSMCFSLDAPFETKQSIYGNKDIAIISFHHYPLIRILEKGEYQSIKDRSENTVLLLNQHIKNPEDIGKLSLSMTLNIYSISVESQNILSIYPEEIQFYGLPIKSLLTNWIGKMNRINTIIKSEETSPQIDNKSEIIESTKPLKTEAKTKQLTSSSNTKKQKELKQKKPINFKIIKLILVLVVIIALLTLTIIMLIRKNKNKSTNNSSEETITIDADETVEVEPEPEETPISNDPPKLTEAELEARIAAATKDRKKNPKPAASQSISMDGLALSQDEMNLFLNTAPVISPMEAAIKKDLAEDAKILQKGIMANSETTKQEKAIRLSAIKLSYERISNLLGISMLEVDEFLKKSSDSTSTPNSLSTDLTEEDSGIIPFSESDSNPINLPEDMDPDLKEELVRILSSTDYSLYDKAFQMAAICLSNDEIASYLGIDPKSVAPLLKEGESSGSIPTPDAPIDSIVVDTIENPAPSNNSFNLPADMDPDLKEELVRILSSADYSLYDKAFQMAAICLSNDEIASYLGIDPKSVAPLLKEGEASGSIPTPDAPIENTKPKLSEETQKKRDGIIANKLLSKTEKVVQLTAIKVDREDISKLLDIDDLEIEMILQ